ncbi:MULTISPECIES: hypothetical protein [unclassified Streptomyces]|uniref:hypothetical protein n=1 Tax=unclassified Streptomyces TaxID=2593676 RepID=UPI00343A4787
MARITTPVPGYSGQGPGNVYFSNGVAESDDPAVLAYCRAAGYGINADPPEPESPTVPDPREVTTIMVGAPARDAAVDPRPGDAQVPAGAGEANPHGPDVVAPGLPAAPAADTPPAAPAPHDDGGHSAGPQEPRPPQSAPVADWRGWVIRNRVDNDPAVHAEVEKLTKAELIKQYGG